MIRIFTTFRIACLATVLIAWSSGTLVLAQEAPPEIPKQLDDSANALVLIANDPTWRVVEGPPSDTDMTIRDLIRGWAQQSEESVEFGKYSIGFIRMSGSPNGDTLGRLTVYPVRGNPHGYGGRTYHQAGTRTKGDEAFDLAVRRLQDALTTIHQVKTGAQIKVYEIAVMQRDEASAKIHRAEAELESLRREGRKQGVPPGALSGGLDEQLTKLRQDWLKLRVERAGLNARHGAIVDQIAMRKDKLSEAEQDRQEFLDELAKIVTLREEQVVNLVRLLKANVVSDAEMAEPQVQLATARAELAQQRQLVAQEAGSQLFDRLNGQLADVQIDMAAVEAQLRTTDEALNELSSESVRGLSIALDLATRRLETALENEEAAAAEVTRARRSVDAVPRPRVVIISQEKPSK